MATIFALAHIFMIFLMLFVVVRIIFNKADFEAEQTYFNQNFYDAENPTFKYWVWSIWASAAFFLLGLVFPPLFLGQLVSSLVSKVIAWVWLYQSYDKGYVNKWITDLKASFESKK